MDEHSSLRRRKAKPSYPAFAKYNTNLGKRGILDDAFQSPQIDFCYTSKVWLAVFLFYFGIFAIVYYCDVIRVPQPMLISDVEKHNVSRNKFFSEERARNFLHEMSSIGPKPTGSYENEVIAVNYLTNLLAHFKSVSKSANIIEVDVQNVSGCFPLGMIDGMSSCYNNVKNIVAKIGPHNSTKRNLLINCHFDSVPTSPGASDDLASCAVMLEALLALSLSEEPLSYPIIFLFNGAEENILQAAHGFITKHKWAKDIAGFINLEACGSGGKQMLFQASRKNTWVLESYVKSVRYPYGSVIAQDIFTSGLVPSDTDYRIFEQFGGLPGLDFAYVKNGYIYHTKLDSPEFINSGSLQQSGDNLLGLIHNILNSSGLEDFPTLSSKQYVFFDFLGIIMIWYSKNTALIVNICIFIPIMAEFLSSVELDGISGWSVTSRIKKIFQTVLFLILNLLAAVGVTLVVSLLLYFFGSTMSWYQNPVFIAGLFGCPSLSIMFCLHSFVKRCREQTSGDKDLLYQGVHLVAAQFVWVIILIIMQLFGLDSSFICTAWIYIPPIVAYICTKVFNFLGLKITPTLYAVQLLLMQVIPSLLLIYCMWSIYMVFIPIMGRIGALVNPDILIGVLTSIFVFLATVYMLSLVQLTISVKKIVAFLTAMFSVTLFLVCFTPVGFPYSSNPQSPAMMRCYILHTSRTFWNKSNGITKDSGYWIAPLDYNGPTMLQNYIPGLKESDLVDCDSNLACGMPFYLPVLSLLRKTYFLHSVPPKLHNKKKFAMVSKKYIGPELLELAFKIEGPDHMTLILSPQKEIGLVEWSLYAGTPFQGLPWKDRKTYFIYYSYGEFTDPWELSFVFKVPINHSDSASVVDILFATHHLHGQDSVSEEFQSLIEAIPDWIHVTPWASTVDMYTF